MAGRRRVRRIYRRGMTGEKLRSAVLVGPTCAKLYIVLSIWGCIMLGLLSMVIREGSYLGELGNRDRAVNVTGYASIGFVGLGLFCLCQANVNKAREAELERRRRLVGMHASIHH